ncbi:hypothetical protein RKD31_000618 [Streptomyces sp. SAI-163]
MARPQKPLDFSLYAQAQLAKYLRDIHARTGLSFAELAQRTVSSPATLKRAASRQGSATTHGRRGLRPGLHPPRAGPRPVHRRHRPPVETRPPRREAPRPRLRRAASPRPQRWSDALAASMPCPTAPPTASSSTAPYREPNTNSSVSSSRAKHRRSAVTSGWRHCTSAWPARTRARPSRRFSPPRPEPRAHPALRARSRSPRPPASCRSRGCGSRGPHGFSFRHPDHTQCDLRNHCDRREWSGGCKKFLLPGIRIRPSAACKG